MLKIGSKEVAEIKVGSKNVEAVYYGSKLVWTKAGPQSCIPGNIWRDELVWDDTMIWAD